MFYYFDNNDILISINTKNMTSTEKKIYRGIGLVDGVFYVGELDTSSNTIKEDSYVWKHVELKNIKESSLPEYPNYKYGYYPYNTYTKTFSVDVQVNLTSLGDVPIIHTFIVRNGLVLFLDQTIRYLNMYIEEKGNIDNIDWEYLDNIGLEWNWYVANDQSFPKLERITETYIRALIDMTWEHHHYETPNMGRLQGKEWDTCVLTIEEDECDKYLLSLLKDTLKQSYKTVYIENNCIYLSTRKFDPWDYDSDDKPEGNSPNSFLLSKMIVDVVEKYNDKDRIICLLSK